MAVTIQSIATQNILINTEFKLDINISGNKITKVVVENLPIEFNYNWTGTQCQIRGKSDRLISGAQITVKATDDDSTVERSWILNVVPAAPIIKSIDKLIFVRGTINKVEIPIANSPCEVSVRGVFIGLKSDPTEVGVVLSGYIPSESEANFTIDHGTIHVVARNGGGTDEADIDWEFN